ncbi:MAG: FMN-binding protein [Thermodesulfobacteriota bacterium]|nr:FMN-binding protein [Thermodesulfobacteriota bacterium]
MKEILRITIALTLSCLIAATVMGLAFVMTAKAKKHNEDLYMQETMLGLLGYSKARPAPSDLRFYGVYRYIIADGDRRFLGYMVPVKRGGEQNYALVVMDLKGRFVETMDLSISPEAAGDAPEREKALRVALGPPKAVTYGDTTIIAKRGERRLAYLLPGSFPGFKTFISIMLALDPSFKVLGLEIMEHEEDPGLGAEIEEEYFKHQFKGKTFERIKTIDVVREPLPEQYKKYLERSTWQEGAFTEEEIEEIGRTYEDKDIYAITGATISSKSVSDGVRNMTKRFSYRMGSLDRVIASQGVEVLF